MDHTRGPTNRAPVSPWGPVIGSRSALGRKTPWDCAYGMTLPVPPLNPKIDVKTAA